MREEMTMTRKLSFERAKAQYVHRFTMDHVPQWARKARPDGAFCAPQFASDREWYDNTVFEGESELASRSHCYTNGQTWPLGKALDKPLR